MKQLGNLAVVCANRDDVLMQIYEKMVVVYVGFGPDRTHMMASWDDDKKLGEITYELNHGRYALKTNADSMQKAA